MSSICASFLFPSWDAKCVVHWQWIQSSSSSSHNESKRFLGSCSSGLNNDPRLCPSSGPSPSSLGVPSRALFRLGAVPPTTPSWNVGWSVRSGTASSCSSEDALLSLRNRSSPVLRSSCVAAAFLTLLCAVKLLRLLEAREKHIGLFRCHTALLVEVHYKTRDRSQQNDKEQHQNQNGSKRGAKPVRLVALNSAANSQGA